MIITNEDLDTNNEVKFLIPRYDTKTHSLDLHHNEGGYGLELNSFKNFPDVFHGDVHLTCLLIDNLNDIGTKYLTKLIDLYLPIQIQKNISGLALIQCRNIICKYPLEQSFPRYYRALQILDQFRKPDEIGDILGYQEALIAADLAEFI